MWGKMRRLGWGSIGLNEAGEWENEKLNYGFRVNPICSKCRSKAKASWIHFRVPYRYSSCLVEAPGSLPATASFPRFLKTCHPVLASSVEGVSTANLTLMWV